MSLIEEIRALNDFTDLKKLHGIWERIALMDVTNPENREIIKLAREKKII